MNYVARNKELRDAGPPLSVRFNNIGVLAYCHVILTSGIALAIFVFHVTPGVRVTRPADNSDMRS